MTEPTFRCGWRYTRAHRHDILPFAFQPTVTIRRGEWQLNMLAEVFDSMPDESFADYVGRCYRDGAFDHLAADLDTLARQLLGELEAAGEIAVVDDVVPADVQDALYRWDRARRDMEGER